MPPPNTAQARATTQPLPIVAVTMGDPAGIGPEICLRLLERSPAMCGCLPVIFGDAAVLGQAAEACQLPPPKRVLSLEQWDAGEPTLTGPCVLDIPSAGIRVTPGEVDAATGRAAYSYIEKAIEAAMAGRVDAVTTGPIHKEALREAGLPYPGHTEILAEKTEAKRTCMMLTSDEVTCSLVTTHVGYRDVPDLLNKARIEEVILLTHEAMTMLRGRPVKIVVCGLNPHAGEHGLFGQSEEERIIAPAVAAAREHGIDVEGPLSPDTAFLASRRKVTDAFVCMYHDQGLIPLKALAFDTAINITLGLPIIRTSVDHGTALDIAWKGLANPGSLFHALALAAKLSGGTL